MRSQFGRLKVIDQRTKQRARFGRVVGAEVTDVHIQGESGTFGPGVNCQMGFSEHHGASETRAFKLMKAHIHDGEASSLNHGDAARLEILAIE
jgi:hypothetical protein